MTPDFRYAYNQCMKKKVVRAKKQSYLHKPTFLLILGVLLLLIAYQLGRGTFTFGSDAAKPLKEQCSLLGGICTSASECSSAQGSNLGRFKCKGNHICCKPAEPTPTPTLMPTTSDSKRVFLTSVQYSGDLGGLAGADAKCQSRAEAGGLGGNWKAWISDSQTPASSRVTRTSGQYLLINGSIVADNWGDLTDGTIQNAININEYGSSPNYGSCVWTSTKTDGSIFEPYGNMNLCSDYHAADDSYSMCGHNYSTNHEWTEWSTERCDYPHPLFCFEQ